MLEVLNEVEPEVVGGPEQPVDVTAIELLLYLRGAAGGGIILLRYRRSEGAVGFL